MLNSTVAAGLTSYVVIKGDSEVTYIIKNELWFIYEVPPHLAAVRDSLLFIVRLLISAS